MRHRVKVECELQDSFESSAVRGMFDISPAKSASEEFEVELPDDDDWQIGVIVGPSGSGKTTVAKQAYGESFVERFEWPHDQSVVAAIGGDSVKDSTHILASVGFSSPPSWLKPYHVLSGGERFRCDLARSLLLPGELVAFDEFTSVVDRTVAKVGSAAVSKSIRKGIVQKRFVAVTCHYDVIDWMEPDWVLDMLNCQLARGCLRRRPTVDLRVGQVKRSAWSIFRRHHYLDHSLNKFSKCFAAFHEGKPVAMVAVIHFPHAKGAYWREHRTVVLPDYQGLGIGNRLSELVASAFVATGRAYFASTIHPAHVHHRVASDKWRVTQGASRRGRAKQSKKIGVGRTTSQSRMIMSFQYTGEPNPELAASWGLLS